MFDLHGIAFSKGGQKCEAPVVPQVTITVDGKQLIMPTTPIRSTNLNGYTDLCHYQMYGPLKDNSVIKATASDPAVKCTVGAITNGRSVVKATYKGIEKIYLIN